MNWNNGRPDDWTNPYFNISTPMTTRWQEACKIAYEAGASAMLAARDKWWIDRLNEEHIVIRLTDDQDEFTPGDYIAMPLERWKNLKKESGS